MPQVLKDEVRARLEAAALAVFAERGYPGATMTAIAERAGVGTASTYRYYGGKQELFDAMVTPELTAEFDALLARRVRALARSMTGAAPRSGAGGGDELLTFWVRHRLQVVILLDRAEGTAYADFGARFVERLLAAVLAELGPGKRAAGGPARFVLTRIFDNTRRMLAAILEAHADEGELREAVEAFWSYQIPGLRGFTARLAGG